MFYFVSLFTLFTQGIYLKYTYKFRSFTCNNVSVTINTSVKCEMNDAIATPFVKVVKVISISLVMRESDISGFAFTISLKTKDQQYSDATNVPKIMTHDPCPLLNSFSLRIPLSSNWWMTYFPAHNAVTNAQISRKNFRTTNSIFCG